MKIADITIHEDDIEEWKASKDTCKKTTPIGASAEASCKAQGLRARDTKKTQKIGRRRVKLGGTRKKSTTYGGPVKDYGSRDRLPGGRGRLR
jgi:hypothetical protein